MTTPDAGATIPLTRVTGLEVIPTRRSDTRLHVRTVFRWALRGLRGVRLRTTLVGGQRCTTLADLYAFFAAVDAARTPSHGRPPVARPAPPRSTVDADLDRLGL
jgi:hypothetical protein